jgi:hypothetical protein
MSRNPVGWFEIYVQDMPRARAFYEGVFSVKLERLKKLDAEMWAFPLIAEGGGVSGSLVRRRVLVGPSQAHRGFARPADC